MAFRWHANDDQTLNSGIVTLWFFRGSGPVLLGNPIFLWFFRGGPSVPPPPPPSGSAHAKGWMNNGHWNWKIKESSPFGCFVWVDALLPSQWFFSHAGTYPALNQYYKQRIKFLADGHNRLPPVRLEPATSQSQIERSTTVLLRMLLREAKWLSGS